MSQGEEQVAARILVVEDEILVAKDIAQTLRSFGHQVCGTAATGPDAIARAEREKPDLILMDVHLRGEMDGLEAARRIRAGRDVPVVFLTAFADHGTIERARDVDAYGYVLKPFNERELHVAVTIALARHGAARELGQEVRDRTAALAESEERFEILVESIQDYAILLIDPAGRVASWNAGAERLTGWSRGDAIGQPIAIFYVGADASAGRPAAELAVAARDGRFEDETWRARKDGSRFWAHVVTIALRGQEGELTGFAKVVADLTERRRYEEELAAAAERLRALAAHGDAVSEQQRSELAREIHDVLGAELTGLKMDTAWLVRRLERSGLPEAERGPLVERLRAMSGQIDGSIQNVRRIATGLRPGVLDDLGLYAAIEWQAREFEERSGLRVELALPAERFSVERERATAVFRILQELLTNVARHAAARQVSVRVERGERDLRLEVADDGRGITREELEAVKALGILGMRERAALFGGSILISGAPGRGTLAVLRIPIES